MPINFSDLFLDLNRFVCNEGGDLNPLLFPDLCRWCTLPSGRGEGGNMGRSFFSVCNSKTITLKMGYEAIVYTNIISPHMCKVIT